MSPWAVKAVLNTHRRRRCADPTCMLCTRCVDRWPTRLRASWDFHELFLWFFVLSLKFWSSVNTIYRNFICGPQAVQAQSGIIFILGVYMSDGCQWYHLSLHRTPLLPGLVYPPEILMLTSSMAGMYDYFPQHTANSVSSLIGRNSKSWQLAYNSRF
jgi:hypothetical protein